MEPKKVLKVHWLREPEYPILRGEQFLESGYIWAPYIPVQVENPDFRPIRGLLSRYARVNNRFYGNINVSDLNGTD